MARSLYPQAMRVSVRLFAGLRERAGGERVELELPDGALVEDLLAAMATTPVGELRPGQCVVAINRSYAGAREPVREGDEVALVPPVSGGAPDTVRAVRITAEPLDLSAAAAAVRDPRAGAVVLFEGVTREVRELDYTAKPPIGWNPGPVPHTVVPGNPGIVNGSVSVAGGRYQLWLRGGTGRAVHVSVDGHELPAVKGIDTPGGWLPVAQLNLRPGRHTLRFESEGDAVRLQAEHLPHPRPRGSPPRTPGRASQRLPRLRHRRLGWRAFRGHGVRRWRRPRAAAPAYRPARE